MNKQLEMEQLLREISVFYKNVPDMDYKKIRDYINCNNREQNLIQIQSIFYKNKKHYSKKEIKVIPYPEFLVIETPDNNLRLPNLFSLDNGFKLYIPLEVNKIYDISSKIVSFIDKNKIPSQYRIKNNYSYDAVTVNFTNKEDASLVANYISNKLKKNVKNTLNPFIPQIGNINICIDGSISYNTVLAKLIDEYMKENKKIDNLDNVYLKDFYNFLCNEISLLEEKQKNYAYFLYELNDKRKYEDFIITSKIIRDTIIGNPSLEDLEEYQKQKKINPEEKYEYTNEEIEEIKKESLREIINILIELYNSNPNINIDIDYLHEVIMDYITNSNVKCFTEYRSIRKVVEDNFSKEEFKKYLLKIGTDILLKVSVDTKMKYGEAQLRIALKEAKETGDISSFTNINGNRSELGLFIPRELLKELIEKNEDKKQSEKEYYEQKQKINVR